MNHHCRWPLLLLALAPAWLSAAETGAASPARPEVGVSTAAAVNAGTGTDAAAEPITPVIPPPGGAAPAPAATQPTGGSVPAETNAATTGEATPNPITTIPAPQLTGTWQAIEVIVFDRPLVGLEPKGELLSSDAPRTFPAALTSLDPPGIEGAVFYPADPRETACQLRFGTPPTAPPNAANQVPAAFTQSADRLGTEPAPAGSSTETATEPPPAEAAGEPALEVPPDPAAELRAALAEYESGLVEQSLTWLPSSTNGLATAASRLEQQGGYRVLFHHTWIQNLARRDPATTVLVQSARDTRGEALLEGTLRVQRSRGTRFDATLWYRPTDADDADTSYIPITASRRLGNGEVVYVDHPKLGIVVRAVEVGIPAAIVEAWQALATTPLPAPASPTGAPAPATAPTGPLPQGAAPAVSRPVE